MVKNPHSTISNSFAYNNYYNIFYIKLQIGTLDFTMKYYPLKLLATLSIFCNSNLYFCLTLEYFSWSTSLKNISTGLIHKLPSPYNLLYTTYFSFFTKLLKKNNLRVIRFHDLRHTCASLLLDEGSNMKQIQVWLGHSNYNTTANIYAHVDSNSMNESANAISNVLSTDKIKNVLATA